jgi:hypothetical protein
MHDQREICYLLNLCYCCGLDVTDCRCLEDQELAAEVAAHSVSCVCCMGDDSAEGTSASWSRWLDSERNDAPLRLYGWRLAHAA